MNALQLAKIRREDMRWHLLRTIYMARPQGLYTETILPVIQSVYPDATHLEVRQELDYLEARRLVEIKRDPTERWYIELHRNGTDIVEYTTDCEPGITRPVFTQG